MRPTVAHKVCSGEGHVSKYGRAAALIDPSTTAGI